MRTHGEYPADWPEIARRVKDEEGWRCERCGVAHGPVPRVLTVHHLDGNKSNCERWNLAALCQRCHLSVQARVDFMQDYFGPHTPWMARHVLAYNAWAREHGKPKLAFTGVTA